MPRKDKEPFVERRQYVRIDCLMAGHVVSISPKESAGKDISVGFTKNLSAGGLLFKDKKKYNIGDIVVVSVNHGTVKELDENLANIIKTREFVLGKIVRKEEFEDGDIFEYGVCFVRNDEEGLDYFSVFVNLINQIEFQEE